MADRLEFQGKLGWILEEAKRQDNRIRKEEIEKYFEEDHLSDEQMELVYDYLLSQKVAVSGYERKHGRILAEEEREKSYSEEEKRYLRNYQMELREAAGRAKEGTFRAFWKRYSGSRNLSMTGASSSGDLVQEGNVSLMLALQETEDEEEILEAVQEGIEAFQEEQKDVHVRDRKMVEKVDELETTDQESSRKRWAERSRWRSWPSIRTGARRRSARF